MFEHQILKRVIKLIILVLFPIIFGTIGYYLIFGSKYSILDYIYMTVITISTVGYGEIINTSGNTLARLLTMMIMVFGMGIMLYAVSSLTAFFVEGTFKDIWRRLKMKKIIQSLKGHIVVCGLGSTGVTVARELALTKKPFVIIEREKSVIERFCNEFPDTLFIHGDGTDEKTLSDSGVERADGLVSCLGDDKDNLFVVVTSKGLNQKIRIIVKVTDLKNKNNFLRSGANSVVSPNFIGGMRLVSEMVRPSVVTFLDNMLRERGDAHRIEEVKVPKGSKIVGKIAKRFIDDELSGCLLMALKNKSDTSFTYIPDEKILIEENMILVLLCSISGLERFKKII